MNALRFLNSGFLNLLWFVVPIVGFFAYCLKKRENIISRFGSKSSTRRLIENAGTQHIIIKNALLVFTFICLVLAVARPQMGSKEEYIKRKGVDIFICLDVSKSMLAQDIKPSRLSKAKHEIEKFIDLLRGDRVGLVVFAGDSIIQCPLTLDYGAAKMFLDVVSPNMVSKGGTSIGSAIETAAEGYVQSEKKHKVMLILTDGESHEGDTIAAATKALEEGIVIYSIGIGSAQGEPIPENSGAPSKGYKKDEDGNIVMSKLDEKALRSIAEKTGGAYFHSSGQEIELKNIYKRIDQMEKKEVGSKQFTQFEERFQFPLLLALILMGVELLVPEYKKVKKEWSGRFE